MVAYKYRFRKYLGFRGWLQCCWYLGGGGGWCSDLVLAKLYLCGGCDFDLIRDLSSVSSVVVVGRDAFFQWKGTL